MDVDSALASISSDGERLVDAAADLEATVPTCPQWSVHDLLGHIGWVHRYVAEHVVRRATERVPPEEMPTAPPGDAVRDYAREGLAAITDALASVDPHEPMWTWGGRQEAGFFLRRMVHETAVHRFDAESVAGEPRGVPDDQGADGVDELYTEILSFGLLRWPRPVPTGTLHLHRTDGGEGEWMIRPDGEGISVAHSHEKGDAAIRGSGSDLFFTIWGRIGLDRVEVFGDEAVARAWVDMSP